MKIGCLNKQTNNTEYIYEYHRFKSLPLPYGSSDYHQYEILTDTVPEQYIWDEQSQSVIQDPNYVAPEPDQTLLGKRAVKEALEFGELLMTDFAGENVGMGITQAGKTAEVLEVMEERVEFDSINKPGVMISVMGTINSGSLYEAINVIDYHIDKCDNGDYDHLSPFITSARLTSIKQEIEDYLGI